MENASPRSSAELRLANRNRVYRRLYASPSPLTKQELANALSMSLPTLTQNLNDLSRQGLIRNSGVADSTGGRKPRTLSVVPRARYAVGVELSAGHIRMVAIDLLVHELAFQALQRPFSADEAYAADLSAALERFLTEHDLERERLLGVGVTVPGIADHDRQLIRSAPTIGVRELDAGYLSAAIGYPTWLTNDATAGGFAEWWGRTGAEDMAYLSLGRGIGGAILIAGVPYFGRSARSGEFGHMSIHPDGRPCSCGRTGCLEAYCSTARLSDDLGVTLEQFFQALSDGDPRYVRSWESYLDDLAVGILNIHAALDCGIVVGGKLSQFLAGRLDDVEGRLRRLDPDFQESPYLSICRYHAHASGIGAALHFVDRFISQI